MFVQVYLCLVSVYFLFRTVATYDATKVDYCKEDMKCDGREHVACRCFASCKYAEVTDDLDRFRAKMVTNHYAPRYKTARGREDVFKPYAGAAAMNHIEYDFELEHLARCWALKERGPLYTHDINPQWCRKTATYNKAEAGQNVAFTKSLEELLDLNPVKRWMDEELPNLEKHKDIIQSFKPFISDNEGNVTFFQIGQLLWEKMTHLGCARACKIELTEYDKRHGEFNCVIVCTYVAKGTQFNIVGKPIFTAGEACSKCEKNHPCGKHRTKGHLTTPIQEPGLCGQFIEIPEQKLAELPVNHPKKVSDLKRHSKQRGASGALAGDDSEHDVFGDEDDGTHHHHGRGGFHRNFSKGRPIAPRRHEGLKEVTFGHLHHDEEFGPRGFGPRRNKSKGDTALDYDDDYYNYAYYIYEYIDFINSTGSGIKPRQIIMPLLGHLAFRLFGPLYHFRLFTLL